MKKNIALFSLASLTIILAACSAEIKTDVPKPHASVEQGKPPVSENTGIVAGKFEATLTANSNPPKLDFTYEMKNQTEKETILSFNSGKKVHFQLKDEYGKEVPIDSSQEFIQAIQEVKLAPGESLQEHFTLSNLQPGKYTLEASLALVEDSNVYKQKLSFEVKPS
ncbi:BsuPI-related putative proteinase inhibitor [Brevibacillus sp. NPDC058079]|uniref:BsuPI-related putative proteinase inhibitor n=1 Tax=Brevibacillus sp. NPDC058079 TaxID=3346330 RepID=UPI0036F1541A